MDLLIDSFISAIALVISLDREMVNIVAVSLKVSCYSTFFASLLGIPIGFAVAFESFRGKRFVITCLNTLLAVPTVVIGLFVYAFISRRGLLGFFDLLYTQKAIIIGQTLLILPVIAAFTIAAISRIDQRYRKTAMMLGANRLQTAYVIFREARYGIVAAVIAAYGRVIAEVGISMMLGGNIKGFTRTMTTAIALETSKGDFALGLALGVILLLVAFVVNVTLYALQGRTA